MKSRNARGGLWRSRWAAIGAAVAVTFGAGGLVAVNASSSSPPSAFVSIDPVRILDTRDPTNIGLAGPLVSATPVDLVVTGTVPTTTGTKVVVPIGATSASMNVTVVTPTAKGFISIRPADATGLPSVSSLNFNAGDIVPNAVTVQLPTSGADQGKIEITYDAYGTVGPTTDILIDVVGYHMTSIPALTASDAYEGPGLEPTTTRFAVVSATLTAPADGKVSVIADAAVDPGFLESAAGVGSGSVGCAITTGDQLLSGHGIGPPPGDNYTPVRDWRDVQFISGVHTFDITAGQTATYQLTCSRSSSTVAAKVYTAHITAIFTAAA